MIREFLDLDLSLAVSFKFSVTRGGAQVEAAEVFGVALGDGVVENGDFETQRAVQLPGIFVH